MTWQPIETVPRDGKEFLAFILINPDSDQKKGIKQGWLSLPIFPFVCKIIPETDEYNESFVEVNRYGDEVMECNPTHWMPLPLPPTEVL